MIEYLPLILFLLFLTFLSGYFSASETAFFSLSPSKIKTFCGSADSKKRLVASLLSHPRDLLVTIFMLNTLVNILLQNVASAMFGSAAGWELKVGVPFVITLVFGEIIPKYIGIQNNISLTQIAAPSINFLQNLLQPVRKLIVAITLPISRFIFFFLKKEESISKEELRHVLKRSQEDGVLLTEEADLVWGYLTFQDTDVREVMRPREEILFYDIEDPLHKLVYLFVDQQCTRIPVCQGKIDNVLGIMTAQKFLAIKTGIADPHDLKRHLLKPFYIPETTPAPLLLRRFDEKGEEIAIVVDEYGSISGLITYEDLVEIVVGKISDLRDQKKLYTKSGDHEIIANAKLELTEFNNLFGVELTSPNNMVTIGGWLTELVGEIPKNGRKVEAQGFLFQVLAADPNRIKRLYIRKLPNRGQNA